MYNTKKNVNQLNIVKIFTHPVSYMYLVLLRHWDISVELFYKFV